MGEMLSLLRAGGLSRRSFVWISGVSLLGVALEAAAMAVAVSIFGVLFNDDEDATVELLGQSVSPLAACSLGIAAALLGAVAGYVVGRRTASVSTTYLAGIRSRLAIAASEASVDAQDGLARGQLEALMTSVAYQASLLPMRAATMASSGAASVALVAIAFVIQPAAAATLGVAGFVLTAAMRPVSAATSAATDRHTDDQGRLAATVTSWADRLRTARAYGVDAPATLPVTEHVEATASSLQSLRALAFSGVVVYRTATIVLLIALVTIAATRRPVDALDATLVLLVVLRALSYSQQFNSARQIAFEAVGPAREITRVSEQLLFDRAHHGQRQLTPPCGVSFQAVSVSIGDVTILAELNMEVAAGDRVAIVGPNGVGKSVVLDVIAGMRAVSAGSVLVGNHDIVDVDPRSRAREIAYVTQSPCVVDCSLADNVRFFRSSIDDENIDRCLELVGLEDGELAARRSVAGAGSHLSGGQAQRLGLARGLVGEPSLLLLDEPTSALDSDSEETVIRALSDQPGSVTMFIVTHRLGPLSLCDRFLGLDRDGLHELDGLDDAIRYCRTLDRVADSNEPA